METQTWLSRHYKSISAENITILFVSSDDFLHAFLEDVEQQMWNYSSYLKNKIYLNSYTGEKEIFRTGNSPSNAI